jgi:hypothetical protein
MRAPIMHTCKAQNSPSTPAGESYRIWRVYRPRQLAREGGGSAAARVARLRSYHVFDQHAEGHAGTRSLHRAVPFLPHRDSRVFIVRPRNWVRKVLVNFLECPGGTGLLQGRFQIPLALELAWSLAFKLNWAGPCAQPAGGTRAWATWGPSMPLSPEAVRD